MYNAYMSRQQWLSIIGVWVMVFLYLGFPTGWDKIFALITGLLIILISFRVTGRGHPPTSRTHKDHASAYVENGEHQQ